MNQLIREKAGMRRMSEFKKSALATRQPETANGQLGDASLTSTRTDWIVSRETVDNETEIRFTKHFTNADVQDSPISGGDDALHGGKGEDSQFSAAKVGAGDTAMDCGWGRYQLSKCTNDSRRIAA
jgi:hypothetical protein